jgi:hypothetical protein
MQMVDRRKARLYLRFFPRPRRRRRGTTNSEFIQAFQRQARKMKQLTLYGKSESYSHQITGQYLDASADESRDRLAESVVNRKKIEVF